MDIRLLLNWMRSIIQFHPRIALLYSGTKTFDEMGKLAEIDWTSYFIGVQMLRVSFLHPEEARHLITKPTLNFPGEAIFPADVVETIITETGCHPFLVQAVCSALITLLNVERQEQATLGDVSRPWRKRWKDGKGISPTCGTARIICSVPAWKRCWGSLEPVNSSWHSAPDWMRKRCDAPSRRC
jgi:hypothetical protein